MKVTPKVTLNLAEMNHAVQTALLRMSASALQNGNHASTYSRKFLERISQEVVGACGEIAFAKFINIPTICSVNSFHNIPDVSGWEVRTTTNETGCLILRDNDDPNRKYVLVVGTPPEMRIVGTIVGKSGMIDRYRKNPNGYRESWFVPQDVLQTFDILTGRTLAPEEIVADDADLNW